MTEATPQTAPEATPAVAEMAEVAALAPAGVSGEIYYAPFPLTITLDGALDDWAGVPQVTIPAGAAPGGDRPAVTFAAAADAGFLYFMGDVTDDNIISGEHGSEYWNEDSVEFYVNATGDLSLGRYVDGVAQITVPALNADRTPAEAVVSGVRGETADARIAAQRTAAGYAVEVAVPLQNDVWAIPLQHGQVIGFQVHLNGASQGDRDTKLIWSVFDTGDTSYQNPGVFGELVFFEIGQSSVARIVPTPAPTIPPAPADAPYKNPDLPVAERVDDLLARMSLAEKIGQMTLIQKDSASAERVTALTLGGLLSGGGGYPVPNTPEAWAAMVDGFQEAALATRLAIPLIYGVDAVHGHNNVAGAVIFPHNVGLGAADDPELMTRIGQITAAEMAATGIYWNYAPVLAVPQDIRWGRTYEAYGEETALVTRLGTAFLRGLQGDDLADPRTALATPKHYVGDGGTTWGSSKARDYVIDRGSTDVDEATLRAVHLPPYLAALEAGARSVMISYSSWDGLKMHGHRYLITDVLKGELGFSGFVVSDWAGIDEVSPSYYLAVVAAIHAGIDMNMVPNDADRFISIMTEAVEAGDISLDRVDDAVRRILTVKFELGLFERPFAQEALLPSVGSAEHRAVAREAVARSVVLLKNDGGALPLDPGIERLYVAGIAADDIGIQSGGWTIEWQGAVGDITAGTTLLEAARARVSAETAVVYEADGRFTGPPADICLAVAGERPYAEGVGDSADLALPAEDLAMLARLPEHCRQLVVVLITGRPLIITELMDGWDALAVAWLPGTEGAGVADVLFGDLPFDGRLPFTWPRSVDQLPFDLAAPAGAEAAPLFPAGFGLRP